MPPCEGYVIIACVNQKARRGSGGSSEGRGSAIWIKETTVNTKNGPATYCQLMRTEYRKGGGSRQRLVLSLGRSERVDMPALEALVEGVNRGRADVLAPQLLPLFPRTWEYGPAALPLRALEATGLERLWARAARETGAIPQAADALRALTVYYLLSYQRGNPFFPWLEQCYVPGGEGLTEEAVAAAVGLLLDDALSLEPVVHAGRALAQEDWGFCYGVPCQYGFFQGGPPSDALFLLSAGDVPLTGRLWEGSPEGEMGELVRRSVLVTRSPELMARHGLGPESCRFICAAPPEGLEALCPDAGEAAAFLREEGEFAPFREYGYRERELPGGLRLFVVRSGPGPAPALSPQHREPRDLILTNTALPARQVLEKFLILDKVLDITHPVYLTEDLQFLSLSYSQEELFAFLERMQLLQLFLCLYLGARLARCRTTLDDALDILRGIRCARLEWPGGGVLLTTPATPRQQEILRLGAV